MRRRYQLTGLTVFLGLAILDPSGSACAQRRDPASAPKKAGPEAPATQFASDQGKLRVMIDGQPVATEDFQITPSGRDWLARGTAVLNVPGGTARVSGKLMLSADGSPLNYEWSTEGEKKKSSANFVFQNGTARMELRLEGAQPFQQDFQFESPRLVVLDNNLYHHYAILARLYDWNAKGTQTFPVLIPQDLTPGTITVEYAGSAQVAGFSQVEALRVRSADLTIELYMDATRRLVKIAVPDSRAEILRTP